MQTLFIQIRHEANVPPDGKLIPPSSQIPDGPFAEGSIGHSSPRHDNVRTDIGVLSSVRHNFIKQLIRSSDKLAAEQSGYPHHKSRRPHAALP